jgi:hypothetical protein
MIRALSWALPEALRKFEDGLDLSFPLSWAKIEPAHALPSVTINAEGLDIVDAVRASTTERNDMVLSHLAFSAPRTSWHN